MLDVYKRQDETGGAGGGFSPGAGPDSPFQRDSFSGRNLCEGTVSYTHLDVYKRQGQPHVGLGAVGTAIYDLSSGMMGDRIMELVLHRGEKLLCDGAFHIVVGAADVYKRQAGGCDRQGEPGAAFLPHAGQDKAYHLSLIHIVG